VTRLLFLDCDGVLADFEAGAKEILGMSPNAFEQRHGTRAFWREIARTKDFYARLPLMADWAAPQKVRWADEHFPGTHIITCMARDKYRHMKGADVLVDDRADHRDKWEAAGGIFVHHRDARSSLAKLAEIYPTIKVPA